jgi:NADH:ubiquinone reductase (non-electrogenic)
MASRVALRTPIALCRPVPRLSLASRRSLATLSTLRQSSRLRTSSASLISRPKIQLSLRRTYADAPSVNLSPTPKPKKRFRFFRFLWRATYLSAIGGIVYLAYTIYDAKNPPDQLEPDPSKKTLVILGKFIEPFRASQRTRTDHFQELDGDQCRC